ncbi:MAG: glycosyltransferase [Oscillospiraceae bacterium]|nr:glycosyltransferase [Oscillospiraceae bacterium]
MYNNHIKVSVIIPSYNHELFIGKAIESVLSQDYNNFEVIVADDCSTDNSVKIIDSFKDNRLNKFFLSKNLGATEILKFLIQKSSGEYISLLNSDDIWYPKKLKKQVEYLDNNKDIAACFTHANFITESGELYEDGCGIPINLFNQNNRSRGSWLNRFYYLGNCLCHPSLMVRKTIYDELGYYNSALRQLPDFDYWVRLILKYPIYILKEVLVGHRILYINGKNTSASTDENCIRDRLEFLNIIKIMMENIDDDIFIEAFKDNFINKSSITTEELFCEKYFILLNGCFYGNYTRDIAINMFINTIDNKNIMECFKQRYNYSFIDLYKETGKQIDILNSPIKKILGKAYLIVDNNILEDNSVLIDDVKQDDNDFTYSFYSNINSDGFRFDPVDGFGISVDHISVFINDNQVSVKSLNGRVFDNNDNKDIFFTLDPQYYIKANVNKFDNIKIIVKNLKILNATNIEIVNGQIIETDIFNETINSLIVKMIDKETMLNQNIINYENLIGFKLIKKINKILINLKRKIKLFYLKQ